MLRELYEFVKDNQDPIHDFLTNQGIQWVLIPPYSPHLGGLWEVVVKSAKTHLRKIIGSSTLTFEELYTILAQIEAYLNSRSLTPMFENIDDLTALTPSHFIIGVPLNEISKPDLSHIPINRLSRYQLLERMRQDFWHQWSQEYLSRL